MEVIDYDSTPNVKYLLRLQPGKLLTNDYRDKPFTHAYNFHMTFKFMLFAYTYNMFFLFFHPFWIR